jgi:myosin heavy subunit
MRIGIIPKYVNSEKTVLNSVIVAPHFESNLQKLCLERRAINVKQRAMKKDAAISTAGIITFGTEAQPIMNELDHATQNKLFSETATRIAEMLKTEISGLVVHRDEAALHAHFQMPAFNKDGIPVSKIITPTVSKRLQDIAGEVFGVHGITRGKPKVQRVIDGDPLHTIIHRSVQQLHNDLPEELAAAESKIQNYKRLIEENRRKLEAGQGDEEKIQKRISVYEQRIESMRSIELNIETEKARLSEKQHELAAAEEKLAETRETLNTNIKTLTKNVTIFKQQKQKFEAEKTSWQTPGAKIGTLLKTVKKSLSNDDEVEQLKNKITELEQRTARAVRAEAARWEPALKEARDDARYAEMKRAETESALRAAEEKLARMQYAMNPHQIKSDFSGPR